MTTAWAHLPNAALIDEVLASLKAHPGKWYAAWNGTRNAASDAAWNEAWDAAWNATQHATRNATRNAAWSTAWSTAQDAAKDAAWDAAWDIAWSVVRDVIAALTAYDDAGRFMKMPVKHLQRLYRIDPHPMYLLLQPAAIVFAED